MSELREHPSYLTLDRHCLGVPDDAAVVEHVRLCQRCRTYVERYAPAQDEPGWLARGLATAASGRRSVGRRGAVAGGVLLAAAAVSMTLFWPRSQPREPYVGVKGSPSALVHVQRAGVTSIWNGEPLTVGDKVRLEVMPEDYGYVSMFSQPSGSAELVPLYAGRVKQHSSSLLPKAWQLDGAPGPELLVILFAHAIISPTAAVALMRARDPHEVVIVRLSLPKRAAR